MHESRTAASLNHPHVIPIYDTGPCEGLLYISMRYVSGADLRAVLHARMQVSPDQAILLVGQAGRGLDAAHRAGLIHRDVKPANILIERGAEDEPNHVYLADFGISKHAVSRSGLTGTGEFVGTIDYIAPEQIKSERIDGRTDIYSLACVLFECLTGRVPFEKDVDAAVIWAHVEEAPPRPTAINPDLPPAIDDVLARGLAKNPDDRYSTCREFLGEAQAALHAALRYASPADAAAVGGPNTVLTEDPARQQPAEGSRDNSTAGTRISRRHALAHDDPAAPAVHSEDSAPHTGGTAPPAARSEDSAARARGTASPGARTEDSAAHAPRSDDHRSSPPEPPTARSRRLWEEPEPEPEPPRRPGRGELEPPRRRRRAGGLIAASLVALVVAGGAIVLLSQGSSSGGASSSSSSSTAAMASHETQNPILAALTQLNAHSAKAKGLVPPSSCKAQDTSMVTCTDPHFGVSKVTFQTFRSLHTLYSKYVSDVRSLSSGRFKPNVGD